MKLLRLLMNVAFWIFVAGMVCSILKSTQPFAVALLLVSIVLFVVASIGVWAIRLKNRPRS